MCSILDNIKEGPPVELFELGKEFKDDKNPSKVNLGVGGKINRLQFEDSFQKYVPII